MSICKKNGWKVLLPGVVSQRAASEASASQVQFSRQKFHDHLLNFIVVDDQVCDIYVF